MPIAKDLCAIARSTVPIELHDKIGKLKINPIKDAPSLYGLRAFNKCESIFHSILVEHINYLRSFETKEAEIVWEHEGLPHFPGIIGVLNLIEGYCRYEQHKLIFKREKDTKDSDVCEKFVSDVYTSFKCKVKDLMETLESLVEDVSNVIQGARTTVQLNLAIIALFLTLLLSIVQMLPLQEWLASLISFIKQFI